MEPDHSVPILKNEQNDTTDDEKNPPIKENT